MNYDWQICTHRKREREKKLLLDIYEVQEVSVARAALMFDRFCFTKKAGFGSGLLESCQLPNSGNPFISLLYYTCFCLRTVKQLFKDFV